MSTTNKQLIKKLMIPVLGFKISFIKYMAPIVTDIVSKSLKINVIVYFKLTDNLLLFLIRYMNSKNIKLKLTDILLANAKPTWSNFFTNNIARTKFNIPDTTFENTGIIVFLVAKNTRDNTIVREVPNIPIV